MTRGKRLRALGRDQAELRLGAGQAYAVMRALDGGAKPRQLFQPAQGRNGREHFSAARDLEPVGCVARLVRMQLPAERVMDAGGQLDFHLVAALDRRARLLEAMQAGPLQLDYGSFVFHASLYRAARSAICAGSRVRAARAVPSIAAAQFTPTAQELLTLARQLEGFAGSRHNLESLASGLTTGTAVTLTTITPDGMRETVTFTAAAPLPPKETASVLEAARRQLLARGIKAPSGWDIALVLMGSAAITPSGPARMPGLLAPAKAEKPFTISLHQFAGSPANYKSLMTGLTQGWTVTLTDPADRRSKLRFTPKGALPAEEAKQTLLLASELLVAQGIQDPTLEEVRAALVGGTVETAAGKKVPLRGVLQATK